MRFNNKFIIRLCDEVKEDNGNTFQYLGKHYSISQYIQLDLLMSFRGTK